MKHFPASIFRSVRLLTLILGASALSLCSFVPVSSSQVPNNTYKPSPISSGIDINDTLTDRDIPTGQKGFARDYIINVQRDERLEITVNASAFDTVLSVLDSNGEVVVENDDTASNNTNSLIFFKIQQTGNYTIRVSSFGGSSGGKFMLRVNKLKVVN